MRSYPYISVVDALDYSAKIYEKERLRPATKESLALTIGYSTRNGSSDAALAALVNYGFLEELEDRQMKITRTFYDILMSDSNDPQRAAAITEAVGRIEAFEQIRSVFGEGPIAEPKLIQYLEDQGANYRTALRTAKVYRATMEFIGHPQGPSTSQARRIITESPDRGNPLEQELKLPIDEGFKVQLLFKGQLTYDRIQRLIEVFQVLQKGYPKTTPASSDDQQKGTN